METWKPIPKHAGYEVSNRGRMRSLGRVIVQHDARGKPYHRRFPGCLLTQSYNDVHGYYYAKVTDDARRHYGLRTAHAVLMAFVGDRPEGTEACHNDGDPANNAVENLRWDTRLSNAADTILHGTSTRGERHPMHALSRASILKIRRSTKTDAELSRIYGVGSRHITKIRKRQTWAWL